nr:MAG TPA: hypothetical protein [Caudoviricetes sp.]
METKKEKYTKIDKKDGIKRAIKSRKNRVLF